MQCILPGTRLSVWRCKELAGPCPALSPTSNCRAVPKRHSGSSALAPLLDDSTAGDLIPELVRHVLKPLIELEVAAVLGAECHDRTDERFGYRNAYGPHLLTTQVGDID